MRQAADRHEELNLRTQAELGAALAQASPRLRPVPTPWPSLAIHGGVIAVWFVLLARAAAADSVVAWSVGLVYIAYDTLLIGFVFTQTLSLLRPRARTSDAARPTLGVLVAAHNEASVLPITLRALFAQEEPADLIVVADDGSQDGTAALLTGRFGLTAPVLGTMSEAERVAPEPALAPPAARRQGARPQRRHRRRRDGAGADGGRRHAARSGRDARDARRLCRGAGARRRHGRAHADLQRHAERPLLPVVPDLRVHPQFPVPLRLGPDGRACC